MITKIFIDLDDTLNSYLYHALKQLGCKGEYNPKHGWNWVVAINEMHPIRSFTEKEVWETLNSLDMADVPRSKEFHTILRLSRSLVAPENICILTSMADVDLLTFKIRWMYSNLPAWLRDSYILATKKYHCASRNALLIDDSETNVNEFREAGGKAILVPRPWNSLHKMELYSSYHLMNEYSKYKKHLQYPQFDGRT